MLMQLNYCYVEIPFIYDPSFKSDSADHVFFFTSPGVQNTNLAPCPKKSIKLRYSLPSLIALIAKRDRMNNGPVTDMVSVLS